MISETMHKMIIMIKGTNVIDMSAGSTTDMEDMEIEVDSLQITTTDHVGPSNVSHVTKTDTDM